MSGNEFRLPPAWGPWLALLLWGSLLFFLLGPLYPLQGQTQSEQLSNIEMELKYSLANCAKLSAVLQMQSARVESLSSDLAALRESLPIYEQKINDLEEELKASGQLSKDLQAEVLRLRDLLQTLQQHLDGLSATFNNYKAAMEKQVKSLERENVVWKVVTGILAACLTGVTIWAAVK